MRMLRWMRSKTENNRTRNESIHEMVQVALQHAFQIKQEKIDKRWFGDVQEDQQLHQVEVGNTSARGRPKSTWVDVTKKDLIRQNKDMASDE